MCLACVLATIEYDEHWLPQYQDNMTEWDIRSLGPQGMVGLVERPSSFPVRQRYRVAMSAHYHKWVCVLLKS